MDKTFLLAKFQTQTTVILVFLVHMVATLATITQTQHVSLVNLDIFS